jgi:gamma-glutamyltranspeptidase/glutathione hydrolase
VQVLLNILRGFTPQAALDAPRFCISAGMPDSESSSTGSAGGVYSEVYFEDGFSKETIAKLRGWYYVLALYILLINMDIDMGHDARVVSGFNRGLMGCGQVIQRLQDPSGCFVWAAGSDLRADGHAAAQI